MKAQSMNIILDGMKFYSFHGVMPQENTVGAEYKVSLDIETDFSTAAETDSLEGTINYAEIYEAVKHEMSIPSKLLEHLAYRISKQDFKTAFQRLSGYKKHWYKHIQGKSSNGSRKQGCGNQSEIFSIKNRQNVWIIKNNTYICRRNNK